MCLLDFSVMVAGSEAAKIGVLFMRKIRKCSFLHKNVLASTHKSLDTNRNFVNSLQQRIS
jgi:hypothetical protein